MTTERPPGYQDEGGYPPPPHGDPDCDPQLIDTVACKAAGVAAQAEYNATYKEDLEKAKTAYTDARDAYRTKRHELTPQVHDLQHQIKHLLERVRCQIEQKRVWCCIKEAFDDICEELVNSCETPAGCCAGDCEYVVDDAYDLDRADLKKRLDQYELEVKKAKACFNDLVTEPDKLAARVAAAKAAIDAINLALSADPATTDLKKVYAQALVAHRNLDPAQIWGGFKEIQDFVDCLCRAQTCWTTGCAAVSVLKGATAVAECKKKAKDVRCTRLKEHTVEEVLAMYDKLCPRYDICEDAGASGSGSDDDENSDCDECNEPGHHHHHPGREHTHEHEGGYQAGGAQRAR